MWAFPADRLVLSYGGNRAKHYCLEHYPYEQCANCGHKVRPYQATLKSHPGTRSKVRTNPDILCSACHAVTEVSAAPDYTPEQVAAVRRLTQDAQVLYALGIPTDEEAS